MGEEDTLLFEADDAVVLACAANAYARRQMNSLYGWTKSADAVPADLVVAARTAWLWLQSCPRTGAWYEGIPEFDDRTAQLHWMFDIVPTMRRIALPDSEPRGGRRTQPVARLGERILREEACAWLFVEPTVRAQNAPVVVELQQRSGNSAICWMYYKRLPPGMELAVAVRQPDADAFARDFAAYTRRVPWGAAPTTEEPEAATCDDHAARRRFLAPMRAWYRAARARVTEQGERDALLARIRDLKKRVWAQRRTIAQVQSRLRSRIYELKAQNAALRAPTRSLSANRDP